MAGQPSAGPYALIPISQNEKAPWYVIRFDKDGNCTGPKTRDHLIDAVKHGDFTDLTRLEQRLERRRRR
jgi:predicted ATP-dependent serine protease